MGKTGDIHPEQIMYIEDVLIAEGSTSVQTSNETITMTMTNIDLFTDYQELTITFEDANQGSLKHVKILKCHPFLTASNFEQAIFVINSANYMTFKRKVNNNKKIVIKTTGCTFKNVKIYGKLK